MLHLNKSFKVNYSSIRDNQVSALNSEMLIRLEINKKDESIVSATSKTKPKIQNKKSKGIRLKAIKIVLSIVLLFFIQWTPLWIFELYKSVKSDSFKSN